MKAVMQLSNLVPDRTTTKVWDEVILTITATGTKDELEWYMRQITSLSKGGK